MKTIFAADLFCGAGGASVGLRRACEALGLGLDLVAINHWPKAVQTHMLNHPGVRHFCESVESVVPREAVPGGHLHLLMAGPSCVHHSRARGGRPVNEQDRASAWCVLRWLSELTVDNLLVENVEEFREWGPVGANGRPLARRKGEIFQQWIKAIEAHGYRVECRVLNAADFGDPTTRRRLWVMARRGTRAIAWPDATHSRDGARTLFGAMKAWRTAREIIDWTVPSRSIFGRPKPLAPKTMARILTGLERFGGPALEPYLVVLRNNMGARALSTPVPTIAAGGQHIGLAEPFVMHVTHGSDAGRVRPMSDPLPTITGANRGELALVEPFIVPHRTFDNMGVDPVTRPLRTITAVNARQFGLVEPFLVPMFGEREGQTPRTHDIDEPLPTVTASKGGPALVEAVITPFYGTSTASPVSAPLPTVTTKDRFGLVLPEVDGRRLDIRFRMLQPHELARAMGFGDDYQFAGNRGDQVKQIGNAWACGVAQALCGSVLERYASRAVALGGAA